MHLEKNQCWRIWTPLARQDSQFPNGCREKGQSNILPTDDEPIASLLDPECEIPLNIHFEISMRLDAGLVRGAQGLSPVQGKLGPGAQLSTFWGWTVGPQMLAAYFQYKKIYYELLSHLNFPWITSFPTLHREIKPYLSLALLVILYSITSPHLAHHSQLCCAFHRKEVCYLWYWYDLNAGGLSVLQRRGTKRNALVFFNASRLPGTGVLAQTGPLSSSERHKATPIYLSILRGSCTELQHSLSRPDELSKHCSW